MSFTYNLGANPVVDYPRLLIGDTQDQNHIFEDEEIASATALQAATFQSSMLYSGPGGRSLPSQPVSYLRVAALLLDCLASSRSRLAGVTKLLDATVDIGKASDSLRKQAQQWREVDDNSGAFMIIEQCPTSFGFMDRFYKQVQRQNAAQ